MNIDLESLQVLAAWTATIVTGAAAIPYVLSIIRGATKPSIATWWIWTIVSLVLALSYQASGATTTFIVALAYVATSGAIAILSLRYGVLDVSPVDMLCLGGTLASLIPWIIFGSPAGTVLIVIAIDALGAIPTIRKILREPNSEDPLAWRIACAGNVISLFAVNAWTPEIAVLPIYYVVSTGCIVLLLRRSKHREGNLSIRLTPSTMTEVLKAYREGLCSRIFLKTPNDLKHLNHLARVKGFFLKNRDHPERESIVDGSTHLSSPINDRVGQLAIGIDTVVDVGCGDARLSRSEMIKDKVYIGIDLAITGVTNSDKTFLIEKPVSPTIDLSTLRSGRALFVLVHVYCYNADSAELTSFLSANSRSGDKLFLIEPKRSLFWERHFSGISLTFRSRNQLEGIVNEAGFDYVDFSSVVLPVSNGRSYIEIGTVVFARRS